MKLDDEHLHLFEQFTNDVPDYDILQSCKSVLCTCTCNTIVQLYVIQIHCFHVYFLKIFSGHLEYNPIISLYTNLYTL